MAEATLTQREQEIVDFWANDGKQYLIPGSIILVIVGIIIGGFIFGAEHPFFTSNDNFLGYSTNVFTELLSVGITILVLDRLNERRQTFREKERLRVLARSRANQVALNAIEEMRFNGWLEGDESLLQNAYLARANLQTVNLANANLQVARLYRANLRGAYLFRTSLEGANLESSDLAEADLRRANLSYTKLSSVNFQDAIMGSANLQGATVSRANLQGARLRRAVLSETNLYRANLQMAYMISVNLAGADLQNANLQGAHLHNVNLVGAKLKGTRFDEKTILPDSVRKSKGRDADGRYFYDKYWSPDVDMTRYTNPEHPDFWQPEWAAAGFDNYRDWQEATKKGSDESDE